MKIYLVGGAVRDALLGLPVKDRDWVVVGSTPQEMLDAGYQQVGRDFPVFLHPQTHEEYALARTERKSGSGYTGFTCYAAPDVTLEDDLKRRDLTINALAQDDNGEIIDPYNGLGDLQNRLLRHVSPAFGEDPLRVLRVARFAARYAHLGFRIADETLALMREMTHAGELEHLTPERVWKETESALTTRNPQVFFQVLRDCGALRVLFPEIDALFGVPAPARWHPEIDTGIHTLMTLSMAAMLSPQVDVRFATLCHDTIKSLFNPINVMYALVVGGLLLIAAECLKPKEPRAPGLDDMTYRQAFMIGCFQCLALWPGFSRSGATISGGMLMGVSRYAASEFSFLLAVPMMMGATALDLYKSWGFLTSGDIPMFAVGFITAFVVALIAIKTFLQLIKRISFIPFAIYRFIVAAAVYVVFF